MEITIKERDNKGFALARQNDERLGMMTYSVAGPELIIIDHTEVEEAHKQKGVGLKMLEALVTMARDKNQKILPLCPFANAMFKRHNEFADVLK
ncbi:GNAT family N-acetyltransferase [Gilvibacter sediminis]|uniref:GNAT family N-acetyltransferase n=1 Tax=Gilvibacter sediminis TaxID=379071 RepID=UPI002350CEC7|nr:GNAT family N-acetyltransferase [Gilvibacter sediminis]MDC7999374.1 GNAT family N-acetyltransferase [Gilvibacter sediminis]